MIRSLCIASILFLTACDAENHSPLQTQDRNLSTLEAGERLEKSGDVAAAAAIYSRILTGPEAPAAAYTRLAAIYRKQGNAAEAVSLLREGQSKYPDNLEIKSQLAYALVAAKKSQEAAGIFDELIAMQPENAMFYNGKAVALDNDRDHASAQEIYQKALSLAPDSLAIMNNLAMSHILSGQLDEAIAMLEPLLRRNDANITVRQNLALAYGLKGDKDRALDISRKDLSPDKAAENLRFYEAYRALQNKSAAE